MPRLKVVHPDYYAEGYIFRCPGCDYDHAIPVRYSPEQIARRGGDRPKWTYNGDIERPTFNPSLLVREYDEAGKTTHVCHSFIRAGRIEFLSDCTHKLKGQTLELPECKETQN